MSNDDVTDDLRKGSDNILKGVGRLRVGFSHFSRSLSIWFNNHPGLKWIILAPVSAIVGNIGIRLLTGVYIYFFGATVPISRDVEVEVFPAPIGFTLWILLWGFILFALLTYFRFVTLRQRIEDLEQQIQS